MGWRWLPLNVKELIRVTRSSGTRFADMESVGDMRYLAAIEFDDGQDIDGLLACFVQAQQRWGLIVKGVLQDRGQAGGECYCADMDLLAIGSDRVFRISQSLGAGSSGCRLHPGALADCSAYLEQEIEQGADLLVLNRFGKGESEGRGFRDLICMALSRGIPVLIAVRPAYLVAWEQFSGDYGITLPFDRNAVSQWFAELDPAHAA